MWGRGGGGQGMANARQMPRNGKCQEESGWNNTAQSQGYRGSGVRLGRASQEGTPGCGLQEKKYNGMDQQVEWEKREGGSEPGGI